MMIDGRKRVKRAGLLRMEEVKRIKIIKDIYKSKKHKEQLLIIKRNKNIRRTSRIASFFYHCENLWEQPESCKNLNKFYDYGTAVTFLAIPASLVCTYIYVYIYTHMYDHVCMSIYIYVIYVYISSKIVVCHSVSLPGAQFAKGSVSSWDTGNMISITFHQASPIMASFSMDNNCHILPWVVPFALGSLEKKQWTKRNSWDMRFTIKQSKRLISPTSLIFLTIWDSDWNDHFAHHFRAKKNGFPVQSLSPDPKNPMGSHGPLKTLASGSCTRFRVLPFVI